MYFVTTSISALCLNVQALSSGPTTLSSNVQALSSGPTTIVLGLECPDLVLATYDNCAWPRMSMPCTVTTLIKSYLRCRPPTLSQSQLIVHTPLHCGFSVVDGRNLLQKWHIWMYWTKSVDLHHVNEYLRIFFHFKNLLVKINKF